MLLPCSIGELLSSDDFSFMSDVELDILDKVFAYIKSCGENIAVSMRKGSVVIL